MAKTVKRHEIKTPAKRAGLNVSGKPYFDEVAPGLHLGYRKGTRGGVWVMRRKVRAGTHPYTVEKIGRADDALEADGVTVLSYWQAHDKVRDRAKLPSRPSGPYTVADAVKDYLTELEGRASHFDTKRRLEACALPIFGATKIDELDSASLKKWHRDLAKAPRRLRTKDGCDQASMTVDLDDDDAARARKVSANRILGQLKAALNLAYRENKVATDAEWRRVQPFKHVDVSRDRYLSLGECRALLKAATEIDSDFGVLVRAALATGARFGHLARLKVKDFDPNGAGGKGTIKVRATSRPGKQRSGYHVILTPDGKRFFEQLVEGRRKDDWLLGREWHKSEQQRPMSKAVERAKIDPPISFNGLRHTYASLSIMGGMSLSAVARNLGHTDTRMVEKHYGHLAMDFVADEVNRHAPRFG